MPHSHLFVQAESHAKPADLAATYDRITQLAQDGGHVTVFLVEDGVLTARQGPHASPLANAVGAGVEVFVDRRSLRDRGIRPSRLVRGARTAGIHALSSRIANGERATWL
jgi:predicted peroxiredoxin